ncbi:MAG: hypothetical protein H7Y19_14590 [Luteimonas sp.]|nr:hypothetical protein [Luteimonas sp.]
MHNAPLYHFVGWGSADDDEKNYRTLCAVLDSQRVGPNDSGFGIRLEIDSNRGLKKGRVDQAGDFLLLRHSL